MLGQRYGRIILGDIEVEFYDHFLWVPRTAAKLAVGDWIEWVCDADPTQPWVWPIRSNTNADSPRTAHRGIRRLGLRPMTRRSRSENSQLIRRPPLHSGQVFGRFLPATRRHDTGLPRLRTC